MILFVIKAGRAAALKALHFTYGKSSPVVASRGSFFLPLTIFILLSITFILTEFHSIADAREINVPDDYSAIQSAIDSAVSGDTILVREGIYSENLSVDKPLSLLSIVGAERTHVEANEAERPVIILRATEGVTIRGFTFKGSNAAGIFLYNVSAANINGNIATGNHTGIRLEHSTGNTVTSNTTIENMEGITLAHSNKNTLNDNIASNNSEKGILLYYSNDNSISKNTTNDNLWNGITLWSSHRNSVSDNVSVQNTYAIVVSDSKDNLLSGNREMRRIYYLLPVVLIYIAALLYLIEKKLFFLYYSRKSKGRQA